MLVEHFNLCYHLFFILSNIYNVSNTRFFFSLTFLALWLQPNCFTFLSNKTYFALCLPKAHLIFILKKTLFILEVCCTNPRSDCASEGFDANWIKHCGFWKHKYDFPECLLLFMERPCALILFLRIIAMIVG